MESIDFEGRNLLIQDSNGNQIFARMETNRAGLKYMHDAVLLAMRPTPEEMKRIADGEPLWLVVTARDITGIQAGTVNPLAGDAYKVEEGGGDE